ncbi:MAG: nucleotidyl transferase AbiEii/AbiGii toxin family protein [Chloroflexota bacterium]|nr:nucleotidyl transferase AbiEii/AbiGii toxin family protein [Chloroflexota bacterium]
MLSRQQLEILNRKSFRYPLQIAEKDYVLALVLQLISQSPLGKKLVFKGGTALHHCYLEQRRFSEDLDFSSIQQPISYKEVQKVLTSVDYLTIKKRYQSTVTMKIERLLYTGPIGFPNSLKIDIDILQNVLLPVQEIYYRTAWGIEFPVRVMEIREICAEKVRAMSDRARYRDFFDMYLILKTHQLDLKEILAYVSQKEIRKPITKTNILRNWYMTGEQKEAEKQAIFYSQPIDDSLIEETLHGLPDFAIS